MLRALALAAVAGAAGAWFLSAPRSLAPDFLDGVEGDAAAGDMVFTAAGCASCHMAEGAADPLRLPGGRAFPTAFGVFFAPNISPDPTHGIGDWTDLQIANAVMRGVGRGGEHLYPALPYTSYRAMTAQDMADLIAYLRLMPADATANLPNEVGFPFDIRRGLGFWKLAFMPAADDFVLAAPGNAAVARGRYLVEVLGHCAECHTPRNALGGLDRDRWLMGGPNPDGEGEIPGIDPASLGWSADDIAAYLESGFTPDFDSAGGAMVEVIANTARLPPEDRAAIAAYLTALPG